MARNDNKKHLQELAALRDTLNNAMRRKDYPLAEQTCHAILALDARDKSLNIMACLYHKDLGEIYLKLLEYDKAIASLNTAREGLIEYRATKKLKFPDDWQRTQSHRTPDPAHPINAF
jgi:tetratricopeptide (TPR) repeat protein